MKTIDKKIHTNIPFQKREISSALFTRFITCCNEEMHLSSSFETKSSEIVFKSLTSIFLLQITPSKLNKKFSKVNFENCIDQFAR